MLKVAVYSIPVLMYVCEIWALRKDEQDLLERILIRKLRWMTGPNRNETTRKEEIRTRAAVANISDRIREARQILVGHVKRKTEECVLTGTWKIEVNGHRMRTWIIKSRCAGPNREKAEYA